MLPCTLEDRKEISDLAVTTRLLVAPPLVLASTSPYRRELLSRLRVPFTCMSPGVDEIERPGEAGLERAERLSIEKACALAAQLPGALIIGADQVAVIDGQVTDKPITHANARRQLARVSGGELTLYSGLALHDTRSGLTRARVIPCRVLFRELSEETIETYLLADQPYDCAGSARIEGLGISLLRGVECEDPSAIIGLPLIALTGLLLEAGYAIPAQPAPLV